MTMKNCDYLPLLDSGLNDSLGSSARRLWTSSTHYRSQQPPPTSSDTAKEHSHLPPKIPLQFVMVKTASISRGQRSLTSHTI
jgi:hypothetical protein